MKKINLNLNASAAANKPPTATSQLTKAIKTIKLNLIITSWVLSLMLLFTDSFLQALIALCCFAASSLLMEKNKAEIDKLIERLDKRLDRLINK